MLYWPKTLTEAPRYIFDGASSDLRPVFLTDFTRQPSDLWHKVLKFLVVGRIPLGARIVAWLTGFEGWKELNRVRPTDRFMADGVTNPRTLQAIAWILPKQTRKFNYFNNCLRFALPGKDIDALMKRMKQMGFELATFDPDDAKQYDLLLTEQFYRPPTAEELQSFNSSARPTGTLDPSRTCQLNPVDCFFCGENKGRRADLDIVAKTLKENGLTHRFFIADTKAEYICYDEYLKHLAACRSIVDWVKGDQKGLTRRPVEAIFWQKKLITNNRNIKTADFYHPDNIFIWGDDDPATLPYFINSPLYPIDNAIVQRYHVDHWLEYFEL